MMRIYHLAFCSFMVCLLSTTQIWGQTSTEEDLRDVLPVRNEKESLSLRDEALRNLRKAVEHIEAAERLSSAGRTTEINFKNLGKTNVLLHHLTNAADQLVLKGEPSGQYLAQSSYSLRLRMLALTKKYREASTNRSKFSDTRPLSILARKNQRPLLKVAALANKQQWEEADRLLIKITDEIHAVDILYEPSAEAEIFKGYWDFRDQLSLKVNEFRLARHREANLRKRKNLTPNFQALLRQLAAARTSIAESGQAQFGLKQVSGPEWVSLFYASWRQAYVESLQCFGLDISRFNVDANNAAPAARELLAELDSFSQRIPKELANIIQADAARATTDSAPQLYENYLRSLSPFVIGEHEEDYIQVLQPVLDDLAARTPELADDVRVYHDVTEDVLRWRQRVADSYHSGKVERFPQLSKQLNLSNKTNGNSQRAIIAAAEKGMLEAVQPVSKILPVIKLSLMNSLVSVQNVSPPPKTDRPSLSQFDNSLFARVNRNYDITSNIADLKSALLITAENPGMTLRTAATIYSAENEAFDIVGGKIEDFSLVGRITFFCNATLDDLGLFGVGADPGAATGGNYYRQVLVECQLNPKWMKHRYFFVEVN